MSHHAMEWLTVAEKVAYLDVSDSDEPESNDEDAAGQGDESNDEDGDYHENEKEVQS